MLGGRLATRQAALREVMAEGHVFNYRACRFCIQHVACHRKKYFWKPGTIERKGWPRLFEKHVAEESFAAQCPSTLNRKTASGFMREQEDRCLDF